MSTLSRVRPDEFTTAMLATVMLGFLLPCRGTRIVRAGTDESALSAHDVRFRAS